MEITIAIIIGLGVGFVCGYLVRNILYKGGENEKRLTDELEKTREELQDYRYKFGTNLRKLANMVSKIQGHYQEVQEYIFSTSQKLASEEGSPSAIHPDAASFIKGANFVKESGPDQ